MLRLRGVHMGVARSPGMDRSALIQALWIRRVAHLIQA